MRGVRITFDDWVSAPEIADLLEIKGGQGWKLGPGTILPQGAFTLGIRPESITPADQGTPGTGFEADVRIAAVELVGAESYVHGTLADGDPLIFRVPGRSHIEIGDLLTVHAEPAGFHIFDANGARLG